MYDAFPFLGRTPWQHSSIPKDVTNATYVPEAHDLLTNPPSYGISDLDGEMNTVCFLSCNSLKSLLTQIPDQIYLVQCHTFSSYHYPSQSTTVLVCYADTYVRRYGWGVLCVAGGGAYYFAKKSINADRAARHEAESKKQARLRRLEQHAPRSDSEQTYSKPKKLKKDPAELEGVAARVEGLDHAGSPSSEASEDVAPVGHSPETLDQKMRERSKYEAAEPYRSKKGDRFS